MNKKNISSKLEDESNADNLKTQLVSQRERLKKGLFKIPQKKMNFMPIPADENIENLEIYNSKDRYKDLFFALSHGVHRGILKKGKYDERIYVVI